MKNKIEIFWQTYLETLLAHSDIPEEPYSAKAFGDTAELANKLAALTPTQDMSLVCERFKVV